VGVVPASLVHRCIEAYMPIKLVLVRDTDQIVLYLLLSGIFACPFGIWFEGVGIEVAEDCVLSANPPRRAVKVSAGDKMKRTIATAARIYVIVPRSANLVALFDDDKVSSLAVFDHIDGGA